jgi:prolyl-tRNA synthetase
VEAIVKDLKNLGVSVKYDNSENKKPGWKFAEYELKGVPVRLAMGARDLENGTIEVARRDTLTKETLPVENIAAYVKNLLDEIQQNIYQKALDFRTKSIIKVDTYDQFKQKIEEGGFLLAPWDGSPETEAQIKDETKATIRCIPLNNPPEAGVDMISGKPSTQRVVFARSY